MNEKALKHLKSTWKTVKKDGGWFALAINGFKPGEARLPLLVVSAKKAVGREELARADVAPQLEKICFGRIVPEGVRTAFVISPDSPVKGEMVLKEAVRALAESKDLKTTLGNAGAGPFRQAQAADLAGEAKVDSVEAVKAAGGKASLKSRLTGGDYSKLLDGLKSWHKLSADGITLANAAKAEKLLAELEKRSASWLDKHADEVDKEGRKQAIERVLAEVRAARLRIQEMNDRVALGDGLNDRLNEALGPTAGFKTAEVRLTKLGELQESLTVRIGNTADPDEKAALHRALFKVEHSVGQRIADRARGLAKRGEQDPPSEEELQTLTVQVRGLAARVCGLLLPAPVGIKATEPGALSESLAQALAGVEALNPALAEELRSEVTHRALVFQAAELRVSAQNGGSQKNFLGSLGRGNPPEIALRAQMVRGLGKGYLNERIVAIREALGGSFTESVTNFDAAARPDAEQTLRRTENLNSRLTKEVTDTQGVLSARVMQRLASFGCVASDIVPSIQSLLPSPDIFPGAPIARPPTVKQVLSAVLKHKPEIAERYLADVAAKVKTFVDNAGIYDPAPEETATHVRELIQARLLNGEGVDLESIVAALQAEGHWVGLITPVDLAGQLERAGLVPVGTADADDDADTRARGVPELVADLRDRQVARELETLDEQLGDLIAPMVNALDALLGPLFSRPQDLPEPILRAVRSAYQLVSDIPLAGEVGGRTMVVDMLMLRCINPLIVEAIVVPDPTSTTGQTTAAPGARYLTAIVQCIANNSQPKEVQSAPFVRYIQQQRPRFVTFVDRVIELALALD